MMTGLYDNTAIPAETKNKPRRRLHRAGLANSLSDIRPDSCYGLSPIVPFQFWAEIRVFNPDLGSASGEARSAFRWSLIHCLRTLLLNGFHPPGGRIGASRDVPAALETRSPPGLSRSNYRALGAPGRCCGCRNSFSQRQKRAPLTTQRQHETAAEILCEVRKDHGTWQS